MSQHAITDSEFGPDMPFAYLSLDAGISEIRLLTILPSEEPSAIIECFIEHISLDNLPSFSALSYCWGSAEDTSPILLNGHTFEATLNLVSALTQLRRDRSSQPFWIDAMCINQKDLSEKDSQILLMSTIFRRARQVVAWIGDGDNETSDAFRLIEKLSSKRKRSMKYDVSSLESLLLREYWQRVWILQELALANEITIQCGSHNTSWEKLCAALQVANKSYHIISGREIEDLQRWHKAVSLNGLREIRAKVNEGTPVNLLYALYTTLKSRSSESRDKVLGLLGLVSDGADYVPNPTYKKSIDDVDMSMTLSYLDTKVNLDPIALLGRGCEDPSVMSGVSPSWVPRWHDLLERGTQQRLEYMTNPFQLRDPLKFWTEGAQIRAQGYSTRRQIHPREEDEEIQLTPFWDTYSLATGRLPPGRSCAAGDSKCRPVNESGILTCPSVAIGVIAQIGMSIKDNDYPLLGEAQSLEVPNPYDNGRNGKEETYAAIYDNFFRLPNRSPRTRPFVMGKTPVRPFLAEFFTIWRKDFYEAGFQPEVQAWVNAHRSFMIYGLSMESWAHWISGTVTGLRWRNKATMKRKNVNGDFFTYACIVNMEYNIESGRKLMITDQGYIGWGHHHARVGDHLYILKGCSVPVILRSRAEGGFHLVGDAYIQGLMQGEAVKNVNSSSWSEVQIY